MRISVLTPNLSNNCYGRAWLLAKLLQNSYDVEIVGPAFGGGIWAPMASFNDFNIKVVKGYPNGKFEFRKMLSLIKGDVIYASKPLVPSFGVGLLKKHISKKPLVLDIDDWELGFGKEFYDSLQWYKKINDYILQIFNFKSYYYKIFLNSLIPLADQTTVSGVVLKRKYGGTIVWHGRDESIFDPNKFEKEKYRHKMLPSYATDKFIYGFVGTPRPHKGVNLLIDTLEILDQRHCLLIAGMANDEYSNSLKAKVDLLNLRKRVIFMNEIGFLELPKILSILDLVVIPQKNNAVAHGQVPAKLFDAMAMGKAIAVTDVDGLPQIIKSYGFTIQLNSIFELANIINYLSLNPNIRKKIEHNARAMFKKEFSWVHLEERLIKIFNSFL